MKALQLAACLLVLFVVLGFTFNAISADAGAMFWLALFLFGVGNLAWWAIDHWRQRPSSN